MKLEVSRDAVEVIRTHAAQAGPEEACGLLLGQGACIREARPTANIATDRAHHFEIDPQPLIDAHRAARGGGQQLLGYYHSHPTGVAEPSDTDRACSARDGMVWAIVAGGKVAFWRDGEAGFEPLGHVLADV